MVPLTCSGDSSSSYVTISVTWTNRAASFSTTATLQCTWTPENQEHENRSLITCQFRRNNTNAKQCEKDRGPVHWGAAAECQHTTTPQETRYKTFSPRGSVNIDSRSQMCWSNTNASETSWEPIMAARVGLCCSRTLISWSIARFPWVSTPLLNIRCADLLPLPPLLCRASGTARLQHIIISEQPVGSGGLLNPSVFFDSVNTTNQETVLQIYFYILPAWGASKLKKKLSKYRLQSYQSRSSVKSLGSGTLFFQVFCDIFSKCPYNFSIITLLTVTGFKYCKMSKTFRKRQKLPTVSSLQFQTERVFGFLTDAG